MADFLELIKTSYLLLTVLKFVGDYQGLQLLYLLFRLVCIVQHQVTMLLLKLLRSFLLLLKPANLIRKDSGKRLKVSSFLGNPPRHIVSWTAVGLRLSHLSKSSLQINFLKVWNLLIRGQ